MKKKTMLTLGLLLFMFLLLLYPSLCLQAAQNGLLLWFHKVLPSLLPFIILINILIPLDSLQPYMSCCTPFARKIWSLPGESFITFLIGLLAGYPMGAKMVRSLYDQQRLSKSEAERTLCFCNNCGPLFIIGTIGTAMLSDTTLGYFLCFTHFLSACILSILVTRTPCEPSCSKRCFSNSTTLHFTTLLNTGVINAMDTITCIGGFIILFSVLLTLLTQTPLSIKWIQLCCHSSNAQILISGILAGILELSNGAHVLSTLPRSAYTLGLISAFLSFGGICVYFQSQLVLEGSNLNTKPFFIAKCLQGLLNFALTLLLYPLYKTYIFSPSQETIAMYTRDTTFYHAVTTNLFYGLCLSSTLILSITGAMHLFRPISHDISSSKSRHSC